MHVKALTFILPIMLAKVKKMNIKYWQESLLGEQSRGSEHLYIIICFMYYKLVEVIKREFDSAYQNSS